MKAQFGHFQAFLAVAEHLNFSTAAGELWLSPSRLSQLIQELEADLGVRLFERTTRSTKLTPAGQSLIPRARAIDRELRTIQSIYGLGSDAVLRIGMRSLPEDFRSQLITQVIEPAVSPRKFESLPLRSDRQLKRLRTGDLDVAIVWGETNDPELAQLPILTETVGVLLPAQPKFKDLERISPSDLIGLRLASTIEPQTMPARLERYFEMLPMVDRVDPAIEGSLTLLLAGGRHCALVPLDRHRTLTYGLDESKVILKRLADPEPRFTSYITWRTDRAEEDWLASLLEHARESFPEPFR